MNSKAFVIREAYLIGDDLQNTARTCVLMCAKSVPFVLVLFLFALPREPSKVTGHDGVGCDAGAE